MRPKRLAFFVASILTLLLGVGAALPALARGNDDGGHGAKQSSSRGERDDSDDDHNDRTWSGRLCNGEAVAIKYRVKDDAVEVVEVDGKESRVEGKGRGTEVVFADHGGKVSFDSHTRKGSRRLNVRADLGKCTPNAAPTSTTVAAPAPMPPTTMVPPTMPPVTVIDPGATQPPATQPPATKPPATQPPINMTTTTAPPATPAPTQPPTTPAPTLPPTTAPPTTTRQIKYLTYSTSAGTITVELDLTDKLNFWAINTPNWKWFAEVPSGSQVRVLLANRATNEQAQFTVSMSGGKPVASFKSDTGGTVTPAAPASTTVAPTKSAASG